MVTVIMLAAALAAQDTSAQHRQTGWPLPLLAHQRQPALEIPKDDKGGNEKRVGRWPAPIATALTLLGWAKDDIPNIEVVATRPPDTSPTAEAWVWCNEDGTAPLVIYVAADTDTYADALQENRQALVKLAGILAHERWHLRYGPDEVGAYEAQLGAMASLTADNAQLTGIRLALRDVRRRGGALSRGSANGCRIASSVLPEFEDPPLEAGGATNPDSHVRATEPVIRALLQTGLSRSATFQRLVDALNQADVIVYVDPLRTREMLGGYLSHDVISAGGYRYLHIAINVRGGDVRVIALLAHELQHAIEVAEDPDAGDARHVDALFRRLASKAGCTIASCSETAAAIKVQNLVDSELKTKR
jgi:hypothetical protein